MKVLVCNLLKKLAAKHQLPFSRCLPIAIAPISEAMWDTKKEVKEAAAACMLVACNSVTNRDIKPFVGPLVRAIQDPTQVGETVHALSSTVFVQSVDSPALAVTVPILLRGCQEKKTEIKRKVPPWPSRSLPLSLYLSISPSQHRNTHLSLPAPTHAQPFPPQGG